jgi:hypothetical protein
MLSTNTTFDITNVIFDQEIYYGEEVEYFTDIPDVTPIRTDSIIYKTVTGIGATHSEIVAPRHSIIVLPHISIVTSKHKYYRSEGINTIAVYGDIKKDDIFNYLATCTGHAKILTTPKGLNKVIQKLDESHMNGKRIPYESLFFLLVDECHKLIQDAFYRSDMVEFIDHFFKFERKAMVSATPIPPSDPRFKKKGFKHIKVCPDYSYKQPIELINADSLVNALQDYLLKNVVERYCIFFNSVEGIKALINQLDLQDDYKIYCSKESTELLKLGDEVNVSNSIGEFKRYNFFTSSFFNGLDIYMDVKPNVLILTDVGYRDHTLLDPYTDILQIIGRFRKTKEQKRNKEQAYNKATHINNAKYFTNPTSQSEALLKIEHSKIIYEHMLTLKQSLYDNSFYSLLDQQLKTVKPYSKLLMANGVFSHFLKDNYLDDERVKKYYTNPSSLLTAYTKTNLFNITSERKLYAKEEIIRLQKRSVRYSLKINKLMAEQLLELEQYKGMAEYYVMREEIEVLSPEMCRAFDLFGYDKLKELNFSMRKIRNELLKDDISKGLNSLPIINLIYQTFHLNTKYLVSEVKEKLITIFQEFGLEQKAKSTDVFRYFEYKEIKMKDERAYVFTSQKLFPIIAKQHI